MRFTARNMVPVEDHLLISDSIKTPQNPHVSQAHVVTTKGKYKDPAYCTNLLRRSYRKDGKKISSPDFPGERLVACHNPELAKMRVHIRDD